MNLISLSVFVCILVCYIVGILGDSHTVDDVPDCQRKWKHFTLLFFVDKFTVFCYLKFDLKNPHTNGQEYTFT